MRNIVALALLGVLWTATAIHAAGPQLVSWDNLLLAARKARRGKRDRAAQTSGTQDQPGNQAWSIPFPSPANKVSNTPESPPPMLMFVP